jgi:superfamily II DNA or RNA helicase
MTRSGGAAGIVGPTVSLGGQRRAIVFAVDVAHVHALTEMFNKHKPGSAIGLDGTAPEAKRRAILDLFRRGAFQYLVNCELLLEGFDDPGIECVVLGRPTMSVTLLIQMVGRGTRLLGLTSAESVARQARCSCWTLLATRAIGCGPADALWRKLFDDLPRN